MALSLRLFVRFRNNDCFTKFYTDINDIELILGFHYNDNIGAQSYLLGDEISLEILVTYPSSILIDFINLDRSN